MCPYASCSLQLRICFCVFIAVNQRRRCFHMDTQRADSDPDATWTKAVSSVTGSRPLTFSQLYTLYTYILFSDYSINVKETNIFICPLGEQCKAHTCPSSGFLLFSFPILTGNRQKTEMRWWWWWWYQYFKAGCSDFSRPLYDSQTSHKLIIVLFLTVDWRRDLFPGDFLDMWSVS